ncbi:MAG: hypothetical protein ACI4DO_02625 [Roseburia sp.]
MKKFSFKFMSMEFLILLVISIVVGLGFSLTSGFTFNGMFLIAILAFIFANCLYWPFIGLIITDKMVTKTIKKKAHENGFDKYASFSTDTEILLIDVENGRMAYVANHNPNEFQIVNPANITEEETGYVKCPFGGTNFVYFSFKYCGKKKKIGTFRSRNPYLLKSAEVLEAMSKADYYCEAIKASRAKALAGE